MKNKEKRNRSGIIWFSIIVVLTILFTIVFVDFIFRISTPKSKITIYELNCSNNSVEIGKKFISNNTIYCSKVIDFKNQLCIGDSCYDVDNLNDMKKCYVGDYTKDYPCDVDLCVFGTVEVRKENFAETTEIWESINKTVEDCTYNKIDKITFNKKNVKITDKWLESNCISVLYTNDWEVTMYWKCNLSYGTFRIEIIGHTQTVEFVPVSNTINENISEYLSDRDKKYFEEKVEEFKSDVEVLKVVEKCKLAISKTMCVYESIPFVYDNKRADEVDSNQLLSPSYFMNNDYYGVCRDISIFRLSVLQLLGVRAHFILKPKHIYIVAEEKGVCYELNNQNVKGGQCV